MNEYLLLALILFIYMNLWYVISILLRRNDIADIAWGLGFVFMAWTSYILFGNLTYLSKGVNMLVTIWGLRLSYHILKRNMNKKEDYRYLEWRKQWGNLFYIRSYFQVFILQGIFLYLIATPIIFINSLNLSPINLLTAIGLLVWTTGLIFEAVADRQLADFISNPENKGKIMQSGLWKYSRHPNYFGEVTLWWGIFIMALSLGGWYVIFSPLTITILILYVSGVPLLENKYEGNQEFEEYKKRTSVFIPLPQKLI